MVRTGHVRWLALALAVLGSPALADSFLVYSEGGIPAGADIFTWCDAGQPCDIAEIQECASPDGSHNLRTNTNIWAGWGVFLNVGGTGTPQPQDLSAFLGGEIRFSVKTPKDLKVEFQCKPSGSTITKTSFISRNGWNGANTWQEIAIPLTDFFAPNPVDVNCLRTVVSPFMSTIENLPFFNTFRVDNIRWRKGNTHAGATRVQVQGRRLLVNGKPFVVNGVAYAPISICEDWHGGLRDRPDRYTVDFPLIADTGANAVRVYSSFLTTAMLDAAWAQGLFVIPTFQVDTTQLQCEAGRNFMRDRLTDMVQEWKNHPAILFWLIGNEVNRNVTDPCLDWYPQLDSMALAAHTAEGTFFHPVGTANSDTTGLTDICRAGCSDDFELPNLDFWALQIYRGCTFASAFNEYQKPNCARPLVITEFGADAWDSLMGPSGAEDAAMQADCLESLLGEADQALAVRNASGVSSGQILFSWADEWWKSSCNPSTDWCNHDSCASWSQPAYPDPAINEEWWGIASLSASDPNARTLRPGAERVSDAWNLGGVCSVKVAGFNRTTGAVSLSFGPGAGSTDHTLYYGPLSAVSTYGYSGSLTGLGATGTSTVTLPSGSLFWVVVPRNHAAEGSYGRNSDCTERPRYAGAGVPQSADRNWQCGWCP